MPRLLRWAALRMHSAVFRGPENCGIYVKSSVERNNVRIEKAGRNLPGRASSRI